ncbi:hypothetical protein ACLOJK_015623 [Asimina triloba]
MSDFLLAEDDVDDDAAISAAACAFARALASFSLRRLAMYSSEITSSEVQNVMGYRKTRADNLCRDEQRLLRRTGRRMMYTW